MIDIPDVGLLKSIDREDMLLNSEIELADSQLKAEESSNLNKTDVMDLLDDCIKDQEDQLLLEDEALLDGSDVRLTMNDADNSTALKLMDLSPSDAATPTSIIFER